MRIKNLQASTSLASSDMLAKDTSGGSTQKITGSNLASQIKSLGNLLATGDVVNNLTSTSTTAPLSAAQGKALNEAIDALWAKAGIRKLVKSYSSVTIPSASYVQLDTISALVGASDNTVSSSDYLIGMNIRGWSSNSGALTLVRSADGTKIMLMGAAQTISSMSVEYHFVRNVFSSVTIS